MTSRSIHSVRRGNVADSGNTNLGNAGQAKRKTVRFPIFWLILIILFLGTWSPTVLGQAIIINESQSFNGYTAAEEAAARRAVAYWNEVIQVPGSLFGPSTVSFNKESLGSGSAAANNVQVSVDSGTTWNTGRNTQIKNGTRNLESIIIHELGHSLWLGLGWYSVNTSSQTVTFDNVSTSSWNGRWSDFLYAGNGTKVQRGQTYAISSSNPFTFRGTNAMRVWGDGSLIPVPVESGQGGPISNGSTISHLNIPYGNMNAYYDANTRPFFSEVELAVMQDLGHVINIRNFFGRSFYQTHAGTIVNNDGFNGTGTYGIGLHLVAGGNTIVQNAHLTSQGYAGAGIRIEGNGNTVTINNGITVAATGEEGVGVLVTHGSSSSNNTINNNGAIAADGQNGSGVWFNARGTLNNQGTIGAANGDGVLFNAVGTLNNYGSGSIDSIRSATSSAVQVNNYDDAYIGAMTLSNGMTVRNGSEIGDLTFNGGSGTYTAWYDKAGEGRQTGFIDTLNVTANSGNIAWGNVNNLNNKASIASVTTAGVVNNGGTIANLTFNGGSYNGTYDSSTGYIGALTVAGDSTGSHWGNIGNLSFGSNGDGMISIVAFADSDWSSISFAGVHADSVQLNYGGIVLDMSGGALETGWGYSSLTFALTDIFGGADVVSGTLDSFQLTWADRWFDVLSDGVFGAGWDIDYTTGYVSWNGTAIVWSSDVPEPATLFILGLGLTGLALARRRMK